MPNKEQITSTMSAFTREHTTQSTPALSREHTTQSTPALRKENPTLLSIQGWVERQLGIYFPEDQAPIFQSRIASLCQQQGLSEEDAWKKLQRGDADFSARIAEAVSTNHTSFFREPEIFSAFCDQIFPTLPPQGDLRIWSAASSSGEEAYSVAISLRRLLGEQAGRARILGSDISERQLALAEKAVYPRQRLAGLAPEYAAYFNAHNEREVRVQPDVAGLCTFRRLNLAQLPWPFQQRFHVIFLRNVLYYFDDSLRQRVVSACFEVTEPGGWLITSLTEPMIDLKTYWKQARPGVYRKESWR